ncbi:MAG: dihydrodipicolinate synthase family protein [Acidobacteria bacterium]|nr:MAG: dihydrodipicolinate synthase family protein [Acidobacteriota bacterium]
MTHRQILAHLKGIFPPVVTPFDRRGEVDDGCFRENLRKYVGVGLGGIVVTGSTGEAPYLTKRERLRLVELARPIIKPPEVMIVGTGLESTRETLRLSREAIARGADALLVVTPNYYKPKMDATALSAHYHALADGVRRPVLIYSIPQFTGVHIDAATIATLSRHPNIVGLKESSGNLAFVREVLCKVRPGFRVLVGSVQILLDSLKAGATGAVLGQATFAPELCVGVYEAFCQGRMKAARDLQQRLLPLAQKISAPYGVAGVKAALDLSGYHGGVPRSPLVPLNAAGRRIVAGALKEARQGLEF